MGTIRKFNDKVNIIGNNVKKYRRKLGLSQADLCIRMQLLGVTMFISDIYEIENNKRLVKDFETKALSLSLNITLDELFIDTDSLF